MLHYPQRGAAVLANSGFSLRELLVAISFARKEYRVSLPRLGSRAVLTSALLLAFAGSVHDATATGDTRTLTLHHTHSGEELTVTFKRNGRYDEEGLKKLNWFLRDWRSQDQTKMNPQLFDIVWEVYRDVDAKQPVQIISAYRAPATNAMLRRRSSGVARHSLHMQGMAMDFFIPGVPLEQIRFAGLRLQRGGVGFYPTSGSPFVHLDVGNVRAWPRLSRQQLVRLFPDGRTVHLPADGTPLPGYAQAQADIQRRNAGASTPSSKSFLASLFGKSTSDDDEDEAPAAAPTRVASAAPVSAAPASLAREENVPLPRMRPAAAAATYQVASATPVRTVAVPAPRPSGGPQTPADIINARGFWDDTPADGQPADAKQALALAVADRDGTASISKALAYARVPERAQIAGAPVPSLTGQRVQTVGLAAHAPALAATSAKVTETMQGRRPWTFAMMVTPSTRSHLTTSAISAYDMTSLSSFMLKPRSAVAMSFAADIQDAMTTDRFSGSAMIALRTVDFSPRNLAAVR